MSTETLTNDECAKIIAEMGSFKREYAVLETAKKVADAAVKYIDFDGDPGESVDVWIEVEDAVREYRALTKEPLLPGKAVLITKACDMTDEESAALAEKQK